MVSRHKGSPVEARPWPAATGPGRLSGVSGPNQAGDAAEPELTAVERRLIEHARAGQWLDLAGAAELTGEQMAGWGAERTVRAEMVRDLLLGRHGGVDPRGVELCGARITGTLDLNDVRTASPLRLTLCHVSTIQARRAHLAHLDLTDVHTTRVDAENLHLDHDLTLTRLHATGAGRDGVIRLTDAHIGGTLNLNGAELISTHGPALAADRVQVAGSVFLREEFTAASASRDGVIRLLGARIGGALECDGAQLTGTNGPALVADVMQVGGSVILRGGFTATSVGALGVIRLPGARIGAALDLSGAELIGTNGPALSAEGTQVDGSVVVHQGRFTVTGDGGLGVIRLTGARIGGQLILDRAELTGTNGSALHADRLQVDTSVFLRGQFSIDAGEHAVIRLYGAQITGELNCNSGRVEHRGGGLGLDLHHCQVGTMRLHRKFTDRLDPRGLRYSGIPDGPEVEDWLRWFRDRGPGLDYAPQPYQQLAAAHRHAGHESEARCILIAQQDDLRTRDKLRRQRRRAHAAAGPQETGAVGDEDELRRQPTLIDRIWSRILRDTIRYGYQSSRALLWLAATLAIAVAVAVPAGVRTIAVHPAGTSTPGRHCSTIEQIGLAATVAVPLINTGISDHCAFDTHQHWGQAFTAIGWVLQLLGWAFATLFVAGFTGIIRKQ
jgi:hypothetical protein